MEDQKESKPLDSVELWNLEPITLRNTGIAPKKKRSIGTKLLLLLCVVAGALFLSFVFFVMIRLRNQIKHTDSNYVKKEVTEYLEKRYNEKFVVMFDRGMGPAYNYVQLFAYPLGCRNSKHKFKVQGYENKWGSLDYFDSYVMIKLMDDYEAYIDPIIDEYFDDYKFYLEFNSEWLRNNLPPDTQLEDLWELRANADYPLPQINLFIKIDNDKIKLPLEKMIDKLSVSYIRCAGYVAFIRDTNKFNILVDDWNVNVDGLDYDNDIATFLIYDDHNYEFRCGGN